MARNEKALDRYIELQHLIHGNICRLEDAVAKHQDDTTPEGIHYGHVGDLEHVLELVQQAASFIAGDNAAE